ncbi:hypothetical protein TraAM80_04568 [Trypanosoma rangeli]|uniref:Uncharacterized protein n=1 Tax=Trypanosoma rangeli TaxID=5698 RepID=A0A422NIU7_TRYRA|nr:uncharacterized protein TraAM80_04568 [Trypanosoma rangeli]RNF05369.1 hypothetical protein TraAM80_04568 [Trypanosoma rangeli]|eukprot:RNF05369.1 hypothetical protein TraAM80_04568 [Trypanosoma rangeli]
MGSAASYGSCKGDGCETPLKANGDDSVGEVTWRVRLLCEVGKDPTSVTRDFPRIPVYVRTASRHNYCAAEEREKQRQHPILGMAAGDSEEAKQEFLASRCERVRTAVELLMELCGEDALALRSVWQVEQQRLGTADGASLLLAVLLKSGMLQVRGKDGRRNSFGSDASGIPAVAAETTPKRATPSHDTADAMVLVLPKYTVQSRTLRVMQYMVQEAVFFPLQWLTGVFRFPWCRRMQDLLWTVHVYAEKDTSEDSDRELIILQHKQTLRHYVDPKERGTTPRFEIDWVCSICIDPLHLLRDVSSPPTMGKDAEVRSIKAEILAARVEAPSRTMCCVAPAWRRRRRELKKRLLDRFKVELDVVAALHERTVF